MAAVVVAVAVVVEVEVGAVEEAVVAVVAVA